MPRRNSVRTTAEQFTFYPADVSACQYPAQHCVTRPVMWRQTGKVIISRIGRRHGIQYGGVRSRQTMALSTSIPILMAASYPRLRRKPYNQCTEMDITSPSGFHSLKLIKNNRTATTVRTERIRFHTTFVGHSRFAPGHIPRILYPSGISHASPNGRPENITTFPSDTVEMAIPLQYS